MKLQDKIIERIRHDGPLPFVEYMRMALYDPDYGYYVTGPAKMGWNGDYFTSTDLGNFFAHCVGRQLIQIWEQLGHLSLFTVIEQGAGRGNLGPGIRSYVQREHAAFANALHYQTEDIRMGLDAVAGQIEHIGQPSVMLSNELVDAFPVHVVEARDGHLYEVYVDTQSGRLHEVLDEPSTEELIGYLERYKIPWQTFDNGWRTEINLDALRWIEHTAQRLLGTGKHKRHGYLLAIDYGDKAHVLYTRHWQRGTLACYFHHQLTERPLAHPGEQDITAHVNFSALIDAGRKHGLRLRSFTTQRQWLESMGIYDEVERLRTQEFALADTARATDKGQVALLQWRTMQQKVATLTDNNGMGNFKVLVMHR